MKYGIFLPTFTPFGSAQIIASLASEAEQAGWDGVFVWDDVAGVESDLADPWIALAAAAVATRRVRLGALITPLARRRPWKVARETVSLDHLSAGRLVFGVGTGAGSAQFGNLGEQPDGRVRAEMLDEGLDVLTGLWRGETFQYEGQHYQLQPTRFCPTPLQQPRIPIWVGGRWPNKRPLARMARWDGMFPLFPVEDTLAEQGAHLRQMLAEVQALRGPNPAAFEVVVTGVTPAENEPQAAEICAGFAAAGATWWLEELEPHRGGSALLSFEQLRARVLAGPPTH